MYLQQNPIDPTLPESVDPADLSNWPEMLDQILGNVFTPANPPLLDLGTALWTGLASIVIAWTGLRIAFSGASFKFWDMIRLIIGLSIPLGMLRFYAVGVPGVGIPFPNIIPAGANQIAEVFRGDIFTEMNIGMQRLDEAYTRNLADADSWVRQGISLTMLNSFVRDSLSFTDALDNIPTAHTVALVPLFVAAFLSSMKIPELASALGGAAASGGGMTSLLTTPGLEWRSTWYATESRPPPSRTPEGGPAIASISRPSMSFRS